MPLRVELGVETQEDLLIQGGPRSYLCFLLGLSDGTNAGQGQFHPIRSYGGLVDLASQAVTVLRGYL